MLLSKLVRLTVDTDSLEIILTKPVDMIVPISNTTLPDRLTDATYANLTRAIWFAKKFPRAILAMSNCSYTFSGAADMEKRLREKILQKAAVTEGVIWAEDMINSADETEKIRDKIQAEKLFPPRYDPECILVVTCQMHTWSARFIYRKVFPNSEILCYGNPWEYETQPDHPVPVQRNPWAWFGANQARLSLAKISWSMYGDFRLLKSLHHKSSI